MRIGAKGRSKGHRQRVPVPQSKSIAGEGTHHKLRAGSAVHETGEKMGGITAAQPLEGGEKGDPYLF